ncbi:hypothetical protein F5Y19DRAFT_445996 [Xylariaceae sp. FL1651]|nr:hypothetical protein F5Y19DRAFT_445996 [Xylariaceae sp. FL1651]
MSAIFLGLKGPKPPPPKTLTGFSRDSIAASRKYFVHDVSKSSLISRLHAEGVVRSTTNADGFDEESREDFVPVIRAINQPQQNQYLSQSPPSMSKLSDAVKALINASHAKPGYTRAGARVQTTLEQLASDARDRKVGLPAWVTVSTAVSATMNCPEAMTQVFHLANANNSRSQRSAAQNAELIREVGLKCISFNGIPRTINTLGAFRNSLPSEVASSLSTAPTRELTPENLEVRKKDGLALWDSVYLGFERKLLDKLAQSHPDLPVHIINGHYSNLLANPRDAQKQEPVGRVLTSLVAVACLRAQTGVGPQVVSHIFGLRKAYENGDAYAEGEQPVEGGEWLASEDGNVWLLESVDKLVHAIGGSEGTTFAPGIRPKL